MKIHYPKKDGKPLCGVYSVWGVPTTPYIRDVSCKSCADFYGAMIGLVLLKRRKKNGRPGDIEKESSGKLKLEVLPGRGKKIE